MILLISSRRFPIIYIMKKYQLPELNADKVFDFHKSGKDSEFDSALKKMEGMYDNIFGS